MSLSRRDVLKLSVAGGAAMALPAQRALAGELTLLNRLAESALPAPYTIPFTVPPVVYPVRSSISTDYYRVTMEPFVAEVVPGLDTSWVSTGGTVAFCMTRCGLLSISTLAASLIQSRRMLAHPQQVGRPAP